ncbi:MAG: hypothetical protein JO325_11720 [Solirubrobacterales bacterium]|nr:hypothetical protein [Solirubrobacterales bacterium]
MRRPITTLLCILATGLPPAGVALAARPLAPAHLLVYAQEWSLWPSRTSVPAGTVIVQLWNRGQDSHDLRIRRLNAHGQMTGPILGAVRITPSGQVSQATWHLKTGRYEIYCSLPGHLMMGMHTRLTVTRA